MYERKINPSSLALLVFFLFTVILQQACIAQKQEACGPSSCGKITNISYPFRLKNDPPNCGNPKQLLLHSTPNFSDSYTSDRVDAYEYYNAYDNLFEHVIYLNCSNRASDDPKYVDTASCINWNSNGHIYAIAKYLSAQKLKVDCRVMMVAATSLRGPEDYDYIYNQSFSYDDIHRALSYGFEVSWLKVFCIDHCGEPRCYYNGTTKAFACSRDYCYTPLGFPTTKCGKTRLIFKFSFR
ncbi:hypothetical protein L6164_026479 [Bauhinia variegata]|uniref:Uncharacterized protein n=1 Tax=Bauhinia variegata TaxID=167791 RepID=A0ACB9LRT5_BAUVA|nr:hypothetical protein L6164_026479 [Bauhinia variegata]